MALTAIERLRSLVLSAIEVRGLTDWSDAMVEEWLNLIENIILIAGEIDGLTLNLTASRMVSSDADKKLVSVSDLTAWIAGTADKITVTDNADGTVTLSTPQDIDTDADVTFDTLILDQLKIVLDNGKIYFGGGDDASIYYDGTDFNIKTDEVAASDLKLTCGANKTLELVNVVYEDLQVGLNNLAKGVTAPTDRTYDHGTGGIAFPVLGFAKTNFIWFDVQTSHSMKLNTVLDCHMHFVLPDTTTIGHKIVFQLDVLVSAIGGTWAVPAGSPFTATHTVAAGDNTSHRILEIADIPASNSTVSTVYKCKLTRIDGEATEYAGEVYLEFVDCHYQKNTMGSRQEGAK